MINLNFRFQSKLGIDQEIHFVRLGHQATSDDLTVTIDPGATIVEIDPFLQLMEMDADEFENLIELTIESEKSPFHYFDVAVATGRNARGFDAKFLARVIDAFAFENIEAAEKIRDIMLEKAALQMLEVAA